MHPLHGVALAGGIVILVANTAGVLRVLVVPRAPTRTWAVLPAKASRALFRSVARLARSYDRRDGILALSEPVTLVFLLATWLTLAVVGFGLVGWGLGGQKLGHAFVQSGSSVFTLGFAQGTGHASAALDFVAAATGLVLVALQIAYLPTLYAAFNRRETLVTLLQSRAGSPAWGPELLMRHQMIGVAGDLPTLFGEWERWSADVAESHTTYPSLIYLRSPRSKSSWVVSLVAVLDAAALVNALRPQTAPIEARMCIRMGFACLRGVARASGIRVDEDPSPEGPVDLTYEEFAEAAGELLAAGFPAERSVEEAWPHFRGWRVNYEAAAYAIADRVSAPPGPWTGPRRLFPGVVMTPLRPSDRQPSAPGGSSGGSPEPPAPNPAR